MHTTRLRRRRVTPLVALAVLLHGLALSGLDWAWPHAEAASLPNPPMQVRLVAPAAPTWPAEIPSTVVASPAPPAARPRPRAAAAAPPTPTARVAAPTTAPAEEQMSPPVEWVVAAAPVQPTAAPAPVPVKASASEAAPVYATQLPPGGVLHFNMDRGGLHGSGDLSWRPQAGHYELAFVGRVGPLKVISQTSTGALEPAGIAPVRYTDQRLGRSLQAANFQRSAGKLSYSGPTTEFALHPGLQDRLSWLIQMPGIVAAEPALRVVGAKVVMSVTGANADLSLWAFRCLGHETLEGVDTLSYVREPREPYDTTVKLWLDPARHFLPVQASLQSGGNDSGFTLRLKDVEFSR